MAKGSSKKTSDFAVGDKTQIKVGSTDLTTSVKIDMTSPYVEGGSSLVTVTKIKYNKDGTKSKNKITVTYNDGSEHQFKESRLSSKVFKADKTQNADAGTLKTFKEAKKEAKETNAGTSRDTSAYAESQVQTKTDKTGEYAPINRKKDANWKSGRSTTERKKTKMTKKTKSKAAKDLGKKQDYSGMAIKYSANQLDNENGDYEAEIISLKDSTGTISYRDNPSNDQAPNIPASIEGDSGELTITRNKKGKVKKVTDTRTITVYHHKHIYAPQTSENMRKIIADNGDLPTEVQNEYGYPYKLSNAKGKYDYSFIPGDYRYTNSPVSNLEARMAAVRADLGIPVHGNRDLARSMKFYLYNRYKTYDPNMLFHKCFTHVFFTRPDVNLLAQPGDKDSVGRTYGALMPNEQAWNHTDTAMMWRTNPELFKLLTDCTRCSDSNNFNMLLSNNVTSFSLQDEGVDVIKSQKSWNEHEMSYGVNYKGKIGGEFNCTFDETDEFSIINLMKLWMTYIGNVSNGAWSPHYPNDDELKNGTGYSHAFDRALDYAASVYVFKVAPNGEDVLYWSKYYGVFPISNGANALQWQKGDFEAPKITIPFAYCWKADWNPISLLEFNSIAKIANSSKKQGFVGSFDHSLMHSTRPYVGCPFVEIDLQNPELSPDDVAYGARTSIKLKYRVDTLWGAIGSDKDGSKRSDISLYSNTNIPKSESKDLIEEATPDEDDDNDWG